MKRTTSKRVRRVIGAYLRARNYVDAGPWVVTDVGDASRPFVLTRGQAGAFVGRVAHVEQDGVPLKVGDRLFDSGRVSA